MPLTLTLLLMLMLSSMFAWRQVPHTTACSNDKCVQEHRALSVASLLSERLAPGWRPASGVVPSTLDTVHALAAAEAFKLFQDVVVYSWNLVGYQRAGRGPLGWVLPELPLPHALAASCRAAQRCEDVETLSRQDQLACAMSACMSVRKDRAVCANEPKEPWIAHAARVGRPRRPRERTARWIAKNSMGE